MKLFDVSYERKSTAQFWTYATERIKARGIQHAQKLANDHLKEMSKLEDLPLRINRIDEVKDDDR